MKNECFMVWKPCKHHCVFICGMVVGGKGEPLKSMRSLI